MLVTIDNQLWIGFAEQSGVARIRGRDLQYFELPVMETPVRGLAEARGRLWAVAGGSL